MLENITSLQKYVHTHSGCFKTWTNIFLQPYFAFLAEHLFNCGKVKRFYLKNCWVHSRSVLITYLHSYKVEVFLQP